MMTLRTMVLLLVAAPLLAQSWEIRSQMPNPRHGAASAVVDGKVYLIGGFVGLQDLVGAVDEYDPATNTWKTIAEAPTLRGHMTAAAHDGLIYVFGGSPRAGTFSNALSVVEVFDPKLGLWASLGPMPMPLKLATAETIGDRIYLVGGFNGPDFGDLWEYDPTSDTWTEKASMPSPRAAHGSAVVDGRILVFGGFSTGGGMSARTFQYDPDTDVWTQTADLPVTGFGTVGVASGGQLLAIGGVPSEAGTAWNDVYRYDPAGDAWTAGPSLNEPRNTGTIEEVGGEILYFGGVRGSSMSSSIDDPVTIGSVEALRVGEPSTAVRPASWALIKALR